ncbi:uncharacterized protein PGTG_09902 [Puccinia graminis f. sp. tritici CRL 75-36-700-3]|uniref:Uncharacterized protein n=1 Tax=Puccinia graminis f. sp. tritici (strain CRL 75-36-700-3 / race SCCL) TaxID=418459 RepID=E3KFA7_PUCGT|nr:uncharacterized protein PGTG_09902 [Puccinia graminis f. sp. tritici CRL 75-36-700-3]EFP82934.2 hypothetical protein PGTG_09902 [Puccinia graminis f. sp. tritici CRL 75-36-700-3]
MSWVWTCLKFNGFPGEFGGGARRLPGKVTPLRLRRLQSGLDASPDSLLWAASACEWHVRQRPCGAALRALQYSEACVRLGFSQSPGNASPFRANPGPVGLGIKGGEQSVILIRHPEWKPLFGKLDESQSIPYNMGEGGSVSWFIDQLAHMEACELQASKLPGVRTVKLSESPSSLNQVMMTANILDIGPHLAGDIHFTSVQTRTENTISLRGGGWRGLVKLVMCSIPSSPIRPSAARALLDIMQTFGTGFIAEVPAGVFRPLY